LVNAYRITLFVETGTYFGETAYWASQCFKEVWTIEADEQIYQKAKKKYGDIKMIKFLLGDSKKVLKEIVEHLNHQTLFWLDSHWSGDETYGVDDECPLIEEIKAIVSSERSHFIFIDDSRLFLSPPPEPHKMEQWPTITQVIQTLISGRNEYYIVIIEDVIVAVPEEARLIVANYCREANTRAWKERSRAENLSRGPLHRRWRDRFRFLFN
jgi:hypothetical protein